MKQNMTLEDLITRLTELLGQNFGSTETNIEDVVVTTGDDADLTGRRTVQLVTESTIAPEIEELKRLSEHLRSQVGLITPNEITELNTVIASLEDKL